jgi:hypothetical protein
VKRPKTLKHHFARKDINESEYLLRLKRRKADAMSAHARAKLAYLSGRKHADVDLEFKMLLQSRKTTM